MSNLAKRPTADQVKRLPKALLHDPERRRLGLSLRKQLRQRGAGMPVLNSRGMGDLVVQIEVETPTKLTAKQKELLEAFRETETGDECPQSTGFFAKLKDMWDDLTE